MLSVHAESSCQISIPLFLSLTLSRIWKTEIKIPNVRAQFPTEQSRVHGKSTNNHHRTNSIKRFFIRSHSHCSGEKNWDKKQKTKRRITRMWCASVCALQVKWSICVRRFNTSPNNTSHPKQQHKQFSFQLKLTCTRWFCLAIVAIIRSVCCVLFGSVVGCRFLQSGRYFDEL